MTVAATNTASSTDPCATTRLPQRRRPRSGAHCQLVTIGEHRRGHERGEHGGGRQDDDAGEAGRAVDDRRARLVRMP